MDFSNRVFVQVVSLCVGAVLLGGCGGAPSRSPSDEKLERVDNGEQVSSSAPGNELKGAVPERVWWKKEANVDAMGLDAEQLKQLESIDTEFFGESSRLRKQERKTFSRLISALRENEPGGERVEMTSKAFAACRAQRQELLIWRLVEIRQVLTVEQWSQVKTVAPSVMKIGLFQPFASSEPVTITDEWPPDASSSGE